MIESNTIIHANSLVFNHKGFLILGHSGSGKSDLSLRMIEDGGILISDDYTLLTLKDTSSNNPQIWASCPDNIAGLLEIRGIGILKKPYIQTYKLDYAIELVTEYPRMPNQLYFEYQNIRLRKILLNPFEISVLSKIKHITQIF